MSLQSMHGLPVKPPMVTVNKRGRAGLHCWQSLTEQVAASQSHDGGSVIGGLAKSIILPLYRITRKQSSSEETGLSLS